MKAKEAKGKGKGKKKAQEVTAASSAPGQLWADKYKPQAVADVLGNAANVKKLSSWLQDWDKNFLADKVKPDKSKPKSALLSGPPGIGKTSSATMVLKQLGYHMTELNASDTRSKKSVAAELTEVIQNTVLNVGGQKDQQQKRAIVMDEVDGMGGSDRGGIQELITLIKKSKVPIICICNDRGHTKVRSLANHCLDLRFNRPTKGTIAKRMQAIAEAEGLEVETNAIELLAESLGNDIRMILNALQMWSRTKKSMSYMEAKDGLKTLTKDKMLRVNTFDAAKMIFDLSKPLWDRTDAFFVDYNIMPLFVQQNYLNSLRMSDRDTQVDRMTQAADAVSDADLVAAMVRGTENHWELLTTQAAMNCRIANFTKGPIGNATFPEWFGKNSTTGKRKRLLAELSTHLMWRVSSNRETLRQTYIPALRERLLRPLIESQVQGVEETVDLLDEYGLSRDDLVDVLPEFVLQDGNPDHIKSLSTATKTALTKEYNSRPHTSAALVQAMSAPKKKRKAAVDVDEAAEGEEGAEEAEADEDEEEDVAALQKRFAKKKGRGKAKGKPAAKGKGKGRAKG
ncbi:unnamed protein product [Chrysoparadoxa australica]